MRHTQQNERIIRLSDPVTGEPELLLNFTRLYNTGLYEFCEKRFREKSAQHVGNLYLRVLRTSVFHYDDYLRQKRITDYRSFEREPYRAFLERQQEARTGNRYTEVYINFLVSSINMLINCRD